MAYVRCVIAREQLGQVQLLRVSLFLQQVDVLHHLHARISGLIQRLYLLLNHALERVELLHPFLNKQIDVSS